MTSGFDEQGFFEGAVEPWPAGEVHTVLSPERTGAFAVERWDHQARRFFACRMTMSPAKRYDAGWPVADIGILAVADLASEEEHAVLGCTVPVERAPTILLAARASASAMGGAGFDVLVERTKRVWQLRPARESEAYWALRAATVLASSLLGPILTPDGQLIGVKTARERLERATREASAAKG